MEKFWINLTCYWNNRIKKTAAMCLNLYFFMWSVKKFIKNKQNIFYWFIRNKKTEYWKKFFYKLRKQKKKFSWNLCQKGLLQNGQCQKGPRQNWLCQKDMLPAFCTNVDPNLIADQCNFRAKYLKMVRKTVQKSRSL